MNPLFATLATHGLLIAPAVVPPLAARMLDQGGGIGAIATHGPSQARLQARSEHDARALFLAVDLDRDGSISPGEARMGGASRDTFGRFDRDASGAVESSEFVEAFLRIERKRPDAAASRAAIPRSSVPTPAAEAGSVVRGMGPASMRMQRSREAESRARTRARARMQQLQSGAPTPRAGTQRPNPVLSDPNDKS